jgi:hypothetical protein
MKSKIRKILLDNLKSEHDGGNIDDGSITGGDNTVDQLYDLFVDEATFVRHLENPEVSYPPKEPKDRFSRFAGTSLFPKKKAGEILYTNPKTGKTQKLFEELLPVYTVRYENPNNGGVVYITISAKDKIEAINNAMHNDEFKSHIKKEHYNKSYFNVYKALGNYVIGKVICTDSEPKL